MCGPGGALGAQKGNSVGAQLLHLGQGLHHEPGDVGSLFGHPLFLIFSSGCGPGIFLTPAARMCNSSAGLQNLPRHVACILGLPDMWVHLLMEEWGQGLFLGLGVYE